MDSLRGAKIEVFEPDNDSFTDPDLVVPKDDIASVSTTSRLSRRKDTATIELFNDRGQYSNNADIEIKSGQRVQFRITMGSDIVGWGEDAWGDGAWGGEHLRWTGMIRDVTYTYGGPNSSFIELKADDFVFGIMSKRLAFDSFTDKPIAGPEDGILNQLLSDEAPEIEQSRIEDFSDIKTSYTSNGTDLLEIAISLTRRSEAVMYSRRDRLHFEHLEDKSPKFEVQGSEIGFFDLQLDDEGLVNSVRVDGGTNTAIDSEQTTKNGYQTAKKGNRVQFQVETRKSAISELEIWTRNTGTDETVTVRLQKDDDGSPVAPGDNTSDIANKSLDSEFISEDDYTTFIMPDHTLPEPNPWVIIETDGDTGQDIGVDTSTGVPAHKVWYEYTVTVRQSSKSSRDNYRERETQITDNSLTSASEARSVASEKLDHDAVPEKKFTAPADSERTHHLKVGEVIKLDFPRENAQGEFIVTQRSDTYEHNQLTTDITAQEVGSI